MNDRNPLFTITSLAIIAFSIVSSVRGQQYFFTTLAGQSGSYGDADGTNASARFSAPTGIVVGPSGDIFISDQGNNMIRKCTPGGIVTTLAGAPGGPSEQQDGTGGEARFRFPIGIAIDGNGDLVVADQTTVRRVTTNGVVTTIAGKPWWLSFGPSSDGVGTNATFQGSIVGLAIATNGNIYVADAGDNTIRVIAPDLTVTTIAGSHGQTGSVDGTNSTARFFGPSFLALDGIGNLFVGDSGNETVRQVTTQGVVTTVAGSAGFHTNTVDGVGTNAQFISPGGIVFDGNGNTIITDYATIRTITPQGAVTTIAGFPDTLGSADGLGGIARFSWPAGIAFDAVGNLMVVDSGNRTIRKGVLIQPCHIQNVVMTGGVATLYFTAATNSTYAVESVGSLAVDSNWNLLGTLTVTNIPESFTDFTAGSASERYYRLRQILP